MISENKFFEKNNITGVVFSDPASVVGYAYSIQLDFQGTANVDCELQYSLNGETWITITSPTTSVITNIDVPTASPVGYVQYGGMNNLVRVKITVNSGTPDVQAYIVHSL